MTEPLAGLDAAEKLVEAAREVWETMAGLPITEAEALASIRASGPDGVNGIVGLAGEWSGAVSVYCPEPIALRVTEALLGTPVATMSEEVRDAIGELANMIAGGMKTRITNGKATCSLSLPTVVTGRDYLVSSPSGCRHFRYRCATPAGEFYLELSLRGEERGEPWPT